jgi:hypothetical protein
MEQGSQHSKKCHLVRKAFLVHILTFRPGQALAELPVVDSQPAGF